MARRNGVVSTETNGKGMGGALAVLNPRDANIVEKVAHVVRTWPDWSRHEQEHMDAIVDEVLAHCRDGCGNRFIRNWCDRVLVPALKPLFS